MDDLRDRLERGRLGMREAFLALSVAARRAGVSDDDIFAAHGQFFDANVEIKTAVSALILLAHIRRPG